MGQYTVDLATRFGSAFGAAAERVAINLLGLGYNAQTIEVPSAPANAFVVNQVYEKEEPVYYSAFGTPIYDRFVFSVNGNSYEFALPPLVDLEIEKRLAETTINDNDFVVDNVSGGEVIESWGNGPWDVTLRGILVDMNNHKRPLDQVAELVTLFKENTFIEASSKLFNAVGIKSIYIKKLSLPAMEGFLDTQAYTITARSYAPAELILN